MVVIRREQMEAMDRSMMQRFIDKSIDFIRMNFPEWSSDQSDEALISFIRSMTALAQNYSIRKEINIQRLMEYKITFDFSIPLPSHLARLLKREGLGEESRLELLVWQLEDTLPLIELKLDDLAEEAP